MKINQVDSLGEIVEVDVPDDYFPTPALEDVITDRKALINAQVDSTFAIGMPVITDWGIDHVQGRPEDQIRIAARKDLAQMVLAGVAGATWDADTQWRLLSDKTVAVPTPEAMVTLWATGATWMNAILTGVAWGHKNALDAIAAGTAATNAEKIAAIEAYDWSEGWLTDPVMDLRSGTP